MAILVRTRKILTGILRGHIKYFIFIGTTMIRAETVRPAITGLDTQQLINLVDINLTLAAQLEATA